MDGEDKFFALFPSRKPLIGMIHLAGSSKSEKIKRALEELTVYEEEGLDGAIIEDYHGDFNDVYEALHQISVRGFKIQIGVNVLSNPYSAFELSCKFGSRFVQFDSVQTRDLDLGLYGTLRKKYTELVVLGGVGFKYIPPTGNPLVVDLEQGISRCDAVVTTGSGTGVETPLEKLKQFKDTLGKFPLVVGAGVNLENVQEQLKVSDGAIVGSYFKPGGNTFLPVDRKKVREMVGIVKS